MADFTDEDREWRARDDRRRELGERLGHAVALVGEEAFKRDPIVHNCLRLIVHQELAAEEALGLAVKILSDTKERLMNDMVTIASSRPMGPITIMRETAKDEPDEGGA